MRALTGAVIAILTIVFVFFGFGLAGNSSRALAQQPVPYAQPAPVGGAWAAGGAQQPVLVNCGPGAQTLVRPVWMNGQQVSQVECVPVGGGVVYPAAAQPVAYGAPVYDARVAPARSYAPTHRRVIRHRRSWQKSAMVIGGTTATGAGIGGLIGGKKGALIGAAIGGGASTIYEAGKRR